MKTLAQLRKSIESKQAEYRKISGLNNGVISGATSTESLQSAIHDEIQTYNNRSKRDCYRGGRVVKRERTC